MFLVRSMSLSQIYLLIVAEYMLSWKTRFCENHFTNYFYKHLPNRSTIKIRDVITMNEALQNAFTLIEYMETENLPIRMFIKKHGGFFQEMKTGMLLAPECKVLDCCLESSYIFLIGSYLYYKTEGSYATWFERQRFAEFTHFSGLYSRTLCSSPERRFQTLAELKDVLRSLNY